VDLPSGDSTRVRTEAGAFIAASLRQFSPSAQRAFDGNGSSLNGAVVQLTGFVASTLRQQW
jgi:hypothetical protein